MKASRRDRFPEWLESLEQRHLSDLTFPELRRALQALSRRYVERQKNLTEGAALNSAGKRAAFALFYGPLHFLVVQHVVAALGAGQPAPKRISDLGCGTGVAAAAWARCCGGRPEILAVDVNRWAVSEARLTLARLGLRGSVRQQNLTAFRLPHENESGATRNRDAVIAAYTLNELEPSVRERLRGPLLGSARNGARVLIVEPIARRPVPWWDDWCKECRADGGRCDTWRFEVELPETLARLSRAAGLDHRKLTARTLFLA